MILTKNIRPKLNVHHNAKGILLLVSLLCSAQFHLWAANFQKYNNARATLIHQVNNRAEQPITLAQALDLLGKKHNINFTYRIDLLNDITVNYQPDASADPLKILEDLLQGTGLKYKQFGKRRIVIYENKNDTIQKENTQQEPNKQEPSRQIIREENAQNQEITLKKNTVSINGTVKDSEGNPLIGASVILKSNITLGTTTDVDGAFTLELPDANGTLVVSYIGYLSQELPLEGRTEVTVVLQPSSMALDEVIVVGYGTQRRADVIGAVSSLKGESLNTKNVSTFDAALQGMAAGVSVLSQSGKPGAPSSIKIRGANSIQSSTEPLWVIDGMPVFSSPTGLGSSNQNPMSLINPNDIESIQVLKDAAATSIYGSRGSNGVIIVTTKSGKNGKGTLNVNVSSGISDLTRTPYDMGYVNTQEWFQVMDQAYQNTFGRNFKMQDYYQLAPLAFDEITRAQIEAGNINTDWYDEIFRMGSFTDINLSSSKGAEKSAYYLSANYRSDKGVLDHNQLDRLSVRSNLNFEPFDNLLFETRLSFSYTNNERRDEDMTTLIKFSLPWMPVYNPENPGVYFNPYATGNIRARNDPNNTLNNVKQYRALGNFALQYNLPYVKGLSLRTEFSADIIQSNLVDWRSRNIRLDG
ncbi:MAG: SusC/RagA family TonB-linked outer membrane protein, partial [Saprospiraceae bacterium]